MKYGISIVAVAALMLAAPALGATTWDGSELDGLWNTAGNWDNGLPNGGTTSITNGDSVTLSGTAGDTNVLNVNTGSTLTVTTDLGSGDDLLMDTGGTFNMNAGYYDQGEKFKLYGGGAGSTFNMNGGTVEVDNKLEIYNNSVLDISGGNLKATDGDGIEFNGGIVRVNGIWTGLVGEDLIYLEAVTESGGTFEFLPTAAGEIAPITCLAAASNDLKVILDAGQTAATTLTLFEGGAISAFGTVEVTQGVTTLTEGTWDALGVNQYAIDYVSGTGVQMQVNVIPEPATMSVLAIGGLALLRRKRRA
jgi:hypothetical protein